MSTKRNGWLFLYVLLQGLAPLGMTQPLQGLFLDLADPFPGKMEDLAHLLQGVLVLIVQAEAHLQNALLPGVQGL